jgi:hypothetical protein
VLKEDIKKKQILTITEGHAGNKKFLVRGKYVY